GSMASAGNFAEISGNQNDAGQAEVFGVLSNGMLWEFNPALGGNGWQELVASNVLFTAAPARR
ncbi:MAG TPA: hypothetical protein VMS17_01675, partial [Gemmataceae bacterium]|nr:hypothetical protein [Gemmataceae bacterium]